jgi:hypothetical protein
MRRIRERPDCAFFQICRQLFERIKERRIAVDDEIEHRMKDEVRPFGQSFRSGLQLFAQF